VAAAFFWPVTSIARVWLALASVVAGCGSVGVVVLHRLETRLAPWRLDVEA